MKNNKYMKNVMGGMLAIALIASAVPTRQVEAVTISELQAQVQALLAQLRALNGGAQSGSAICGPFFTDLSLGRTGSEVVALQKFLLNRGYSIPAGATGYFGEQTRTALTAFQNSQGIVPAVGYFGPVTRSKVNMLCSPAIQQPAENTDGDSTGNTDDTTGPRLRGEASLENYNVKSGDDTNLEEGQKNVGVMDVEFDVEDGDVRINRVDLVFTPDVGNNEQDPWDTFSEVSLYSGSERIARVSASDRSKWGEDAPSAGDYRLRMSGLDQVIEEDETAELTIKLSTQNSIKGANDGEVWNIFIPTNGIRGLDASRANVFTGDSAEKVTIDIDEAGSDDEIIVRYSNNDIESATLQLEDGRRSGWMPVFAFDLDTDDSRHDIEIRKLPVQLTVGTSTVSTFVRDLRLSVDGRTYTKKVVTDGSTNTALFEFSRGEFVIENGERITVEVEAEFNALGALYEGTTIVASVNGSDIIAKGADNLVGAQLSGSVTGEVHTLRTGGATLKSVNTTAVASNNTNDIKEDDRGSFTIKFDVTAFSQDIFIARSAERGGSLGTGGVNFLIEDASAGVTETASGTVSAALNSNAKVENGFFKVGEGETKSFTLLVDYDPEYESFFNVQLYSLNWSSSASAPTVQQRALPESKFETGVLSIGN